MALRKIDGARTFEESDRAFEPETGVRRKTLSMPQPERTATVSSSHPTLMLGSFAAAMGAMVLPVPGARAVALASLVMVGFGHLLLTCRRLDVTLDGVRVVFDEESERTLAWSEIRSVTRRRLGWLDAITLHADGGDVHARFTTKDRHRVDAIEALIRSRLDDVTDRA